MKRLISCLLALLLLATPCVQAAAPQPGAAVPAAAANDISNVPASDLAAPDAAAPDTPEAAEPETPDAAEPNAPEAAEPETPDAAAPDAPEATEPETPDAAEPDAPEAAGPETPDAAEPNAPEATEPETPDAAEPDAPETAEPETPDAAEPDAPEAAEPETLQNDVFPGQIDLIIREGLLLGQPVAFTAQLTPLSAENAAQPASASLTLPAGGKADVTQCASASFPALPAGTYVLTLSAPGFAQHTQTVDVPENRAVRLEFYTGFLSGYSYRQDAAHPGVLLACDVNGDGALTGADTAALVDRLDGAETSAPYADLNLDGAVDLLDLAYLAKALQSTGADVSAAPMLAVPTPTLRAETGADTLVADGSAAQMLIGERALVLRTADGGAISQARPVALELYVGEGVGSSAVEALVLKSPADNAITQAAVTVEYQNADGSLGTADIPVSSDIHFLLESEDVTVTLTEDGVIVIDLGSQIAVKKVTIRITGTRKNNNLAEISTVEFLNDLEHRIPEPALDRPEHVLAAPASQAFTLSWDGCKNVNSYEVVLTDKNGRQTEPIAVRTNVLNVTSFLNDKLVNYDPYTAQVRSVNGTWRSIYSDPVTVIPVPSKRPDPPDNVRAVGAYCSIQLSWKKMDDTVSYNVYYRQTGAAQYETITGIEANSCTVTGLGDRVSYELYVTGVNELGESGPSLVQQATTADLNPAAMPRYGLLNKGVAGADDSAIAQVSFRQGEMLPDGTSSFGAADKDPATFYQLNTWDSGGYNPMGATHGLTFTFDQAYELQTFALQEPVVQSPGYFYARVGWTDENGKETIVSASIQQRTDADGRIYYWVRLPQRVKATKLRIGLARYAASGSIAISEVYFYRYDSLEDDIFGLYTDDLHLTLREGVGQSDIDALRARLNTPDADCGEYHPDRASLERELQTAEDILYSRARPALSVHNTITTSDVGRGFSGLNAWQPLGVAAAAGEQIDVYVGCAGKKTGDATNLQLVATQYHANANEAARVVATLKVGRNEIVLPRLSTNQAETGGALYVQYTGQSGAGQYAVRVSGGVPVPTLDLYRVGDRAERIERAAAYITALDAHCAALESAHAEHHMGTDAPALVNLPYDAQNCILGASDILMETMLISLPAAQLRAGLGSGSAQERAQKLVDSMDAMCDMIDLFYQHKGLNPNAAQAVDQYPLQHLNIRYQRMFAGAFMYASGNHIGIEWGSAPGIVQAVPVAADADGKYQSGRYFGWGIAHEIGHNINQGAYAIAEITNNYFSVLAQAKDTNDSVRFLYENIYKKVTSGDKGRASNVFTQLGLYWQLHLAYDSGYNYKTYEDHAQQLQNLFFARVDSYARTPARAPQPGGVALTLTGGTDQALMRLACAAAEKDLLSFFDRWGMTPDADTVAYAAQFAKETRALYYGTDESRVYRLTHGGSSLSADGTTPAVGSCTAQVNAAAANQVDLTLTSTLPAEQVLGYEVTRCTIANGETERMVVGFTTSGSFQDVITTMNNRVVFYEITVVDQYLNRSAVQTLDPLKIEHNGSIDKSGFTVSASGLTETDASPAPDAGELDPCEPQPEPSVRRVLDNDMSTVYRATISDGACVTLALNRTLAVEGVRYRTPDSAAGAYSIEVLCGGEWIEAARGSFAGQDATVYFAKGGNIASYAASAVRISLLDAPGTQIAIAELDVLGVTGDNVDFRRAESGTPAVGRLEADYRLDADTLIPAGSVVFTGIYKGNPAYNVVLLYDQNGGIVGGVDADGALTAHQAIFADVPQTGNIRDTSDGTWIYWIDPEDLAGLSGVTRVRAELYRVDDALTNEGQRLVSDSLFEALPPLETLPPITLTGGASA